MYMYTHACTPTHTHNYQTVSIEYYAEGWSQSAVVHLHRITVIILRVIIPRVIIVACKRVRRVISTLLQGAGG